MHPQALLSRKSPTRVEFEQRATAEVNIKLLCPIFEKKKSPRPEIKETKASFLRKTHTELLLKNLDS